MVERLEDQSVHVESVSDSVHLPVHYQKELGDKVRRVEDLTLDTDLILSGLTDVERAEEYIVFARQLLPHLPVDEQLSFAKDPLRFVSSGLGFRGLTQEKYVNLKRTRTYLPESGHFGSRGVYFSNSPYDAFMYQRQGVIAVVEVKNLNTLNGRGFYELGSEPYKAHTQAYIDALPPTLSKKERSDALYSADEGMDLLEKTTSLNPAIRNIVARQSQSIEVTEVFLVWKDGQVHEELPQRAA